MANTQPDGTSQSTTGANDAFRQSSPFPSGPFDFAFGNYDSLFDMTPAGAGGQSSGIQYMHATGPPATANYITPSSHNAAANTERIPAFVNPATIVDNGYQNVGVDNGNVNYQHLLNYVYPPYHENADLAAPTGSFDNQPYTHVDPTQLLNMDADNQQVQNHSFHASPSSDSWGANNGFSSSTTASPEPYATSAGSTPPSIEATNSNTRRFSHAHKSSQESSGRIAAFAGSNQRKKGAGGQMTMNTGLRSSTSTPDLGTSAELDAVQGGGNGEEGESSVPTVCTNCRTTNTPLWRRDPEGQPLCEWDKCHYGLCTYFITSR